MSSFVLNGSWTEPTLTNEVAEARGAAFDSQKLLGFFDRQVRPAQGRLYLKSGLRIYAIVPAKC